MKRILLTATCLALSATLLGGCSSSAPPPAKDGAKKHEEPHGGEGPHGGTLFATPDHKYHVELKAEKGKPTILYVLDSRARKAIPTAAETFTLMVKRDKPVKVEFKPERGKGETKATQFTAPADKIPEKMDMEKVEISGQIAGKPYHFTLDKE
jgi:hypothetical protein